MEKKNITILAVNGHGKNTSGKCSPKRKDGSRLAEWAFTRSIVRYMVEHGNKYGVNVVVVVPESDDIPNVERYKRANEYIKSHPSERCVLFDVHGNAAGNGKSWCNATGFEAWTTTGQNNSDILAEHLCAVVHDMLPDMRIRCDRTDGDSDKEKNWTTICGANCPAVLSENGFYDNEQECERMLTPAFQSTISEAHIIATLRYFNV